MYLHMILAVITSYAYLVGAISPVHGPSYDVRGQSLNPGLATLPLAPRDLPVGTCK